MDHHQAETALCLWETYITRQAYNKPSEVDAYQERNGVWATRSECLFLAEIVNTLWDSLNGEDDKMDGIVFDFEFVPTLFALNLINDKWRLKSGTHAAMAKWRDDFHARNSRS